MRGYQNPSLHSGNVTDQRGIALRVTVGRPPTLTKLMLGCDALNMKIHGFYILFMYK